MPEFAFRDGKLWITDAHSVTWLRGWPEPAAERKLSHEHVHDFRPDFRLLAPATPTARDLGHILEACDGDAWAERKRAAYAAFRATLPPVATALLENFVSHQWNLLHLLRERPAFCDLLAAHPVLAWCVANNDQFRKLSARSPAFQARWHIHEKQRDLAAWLGFPGTEAFVRLLKKIRLEAVAPFPLRLLQAAAPRAGANLQQLAHLEHINYGALYLACHDTLRAYVTPTLLREVAAQAGELADSPLAGLLTDTLLMHQRRHPGQPAPVFQSTRAVARQHDELVAELNRPVPPPAPPALPPRPPPQRQGARRPRRAAPPPPPQPLPPVQQRDPLDLLPPFPPPPLPGSPDILPITTEAELAQEGRWQNHCVAIYAPQIRARKLYVYTVLKPERATVAIARCRGGYWDLQELRAAYNHGVRPETLAHVRSWLNRTQLAALIAARQG
jgi:hypothetical protein